jgi:hypothetical protein
MNFIPYDLKIHGVRIEFNNMDCSSDKREPFEEEIPIEKKDVLVYLCEKQCDYNPETILDKYLDVKRKTQCFNTPLPYYFKFFIAFNVKKNQKNELETMWQEVNMDLFEYFLGMRKLQGDDLVLKLHYLV